jgi:hypothetical protein
MVGRYWLGARWREYRGVNPPPGITRTRILTHGRPAVSGPPTNAVVPCEEEQRKGPFPGPISAKKGRTA